MSMNVAGRSISKLKIVEDDTNTRDSLAEIVRDINIDPDKIEGPLSSLRAFLASHTYDADAFIFDHHLKQSGYAAFDGAQAVAELYKIRPCILCTGWTNAVTDTIRSYRRHIPSLVRSDEINPDRLAKELEICVNEFNDKFVPSRKPIKTLVRIENIDNTRRPELVYAIIPSWNPKQVISFPVNMIPLGIRANVTDGVRLWAQVNIGAEDHTEIFLDSFEFRG